MLTFRKSAISTAIMMTLASNAFAGVGDVTINGNPYIVDSPSESFELGSDGDTVSITGKTTGSAYQAIILNGKNKPGKIATIKGSSITLKTTMGHGVNSLNRASINIGNDSTTSVFIETSYKGNGSAKYGREFPLKRYRTI